MGRRPSPASTGGATSSLEICGVPVAGTTTYAIPDKRQSAEPWPLSSGTGASLRYRFPEDTAASFATVWLPEDKGLDVDVGVALNSGDPTAESAAVVSLWLDGRSISSVDTTVRRGEWQTVPMHVDKDVLPRGGSVFTIMLATKSTGLPVLGRNLVVYRGSDALTERAPTWPATSAASADWTGLVRTDGSVASKITASPRADGTLTVSGRVRGETYDHSNCGGQTYALVALLDDHPVAIDPKFLHLVSDAERVDFSVDFSGLPTAAGHRLDLVTIGGIGRPFEYPAGKPSPWLDSNPLMVGRISW